MAAPDAILVLGVETSCDETGASVVELSGAESPRLRVLSSVVSGQHGVHATYGGVVPELASRAHLERILPVLHAALSDAGVALAELSAVAVGHRPGLIGSLLVGTSAAKALAWGAGLPFLGVDHVAAHLVAGLLDVEPARFPALGLVVSGGHTSLFRMRSPTEAELIGRTIDDAIGEAFDKAASMLGLPYPGGPEIDRLSDAGRDDAVELPVARLHGDRINFSFSGLKTALLYEVRGVPAAPRRHTPPPAPPPPLDARRRADLAASFQRSAVGAVMRGVRQAFEREPAATLLVGGGVASNRRLRAELEAFAKARGIELRLPPVRFCVDNAAMIAGLGAFRAARGERDPWDLAAQPLSALGMGPGT